MISESLRNLSSKKVYGVVAIVATVFLLYYFSIRIQNVPFEAAKLPTRFTMTGFDDKHALYISSLKTTVTAAKLENILAANLNYSSKYPFPHTLFDGLFPEDVLRAVSLEIPDSPELTEDGCAKGSQKCYTTALQKSKNAFDDEQYFGPATLALFQTLKSEMFTRFLERLTGIEGLIPDPEYRGSGVHQTLSGGLLDIHADFNRYAKYDMHRRVNTFVFLNEDWKESYGGYLELWSKDLKSCGAKISPDMGRFVVFSSTDFSYHGHPHPLSCPQNRSRRSLALYYYTKTRPTNECIKNDCYASHSTLFQKTSCASCDERRCSYLSNQSS